MDKAILHLDLDAFFVSVELLKQPHLRGLPVVVGGGDRGVVSAASYEARRYGIHSAMPAAQARKLCPQAIFLKGSYEDYSKYSRLVTEILADNVPVLEKASIDEFYADLTGMDRFYGCWAWSQMLKRKITDETGLTITIGLSTSKTISKIAVGEHKPDGQVQILPGQEQAFLAPLPVGRIPMVGEKTVSRLLDLGIRTIQDLLDTPISRLEKYLGMHGRYLWEKVNGMEASIVTPHEGRKSISTESTFGADTTSIDFLHKEMLRMVTELTYQLRTEGTTAACLAVKIRYAGFDTFLHQISLPPTAADHVLYRHAVEAFTQLYQVNRPVRLLGVRLTKLAPGGTQLDLFDNTARMAPLYQALDGIRNKYGPDAVRPAAL